jgi:hypothetical protein
MDMFILGFTRFLVEALFFTTTSPWLYTGLWALFITFIIILMIKCYRKPQPPTYRSMRVRTWFNRHLSKTYERFARTMIAKPPSLENVFFKLQSPDRLHLNAMEILTILQHVELPPDAQFSLQKIAIEMFGDLKYSNMFAKYLVQIHPALHKTETIIETVNNKDTFEQVPVVYTLIDRFIVASVSHSEGGCHKHCPYHNETLLVHLFAAAYFSMMSAAKTKDVNPYMAFMTALFHDCVKAETNKKHDDIPCPVHGKAMGLCDHADVHQQCKCARYPGHGLLAEMLLKHFAKHLIMTMPQTLTTRQKIDWFDAITRVVQIHMSFHEPSEKGANQILTPELSAKKLADESIRIKKVLTPETAMVKLLCIHMFAGDNLGKLPHPGFESEKPFEQKYREFWYNVKCLNKEALPLQILNAEAKIILFPVGQSGAGKTTFIERLMKLLSTKHHVQHISRDVCICEIMTGTKTRLVGQEYAEMYTAYNAIKKFHTQQIDFHELMEILTKHKNILAPKFHDLSREKVPDVDKEVSKMFNDQLNEALNDQLTGVIIVDTLMNLWKNEAAKLPYMGDHIQIDVPVANFSRVVSTNNGLELQKQLRLSKSNSLTKPADGDFANEYFKSVLQSPDNRKYQAPSVMLSDSNGIPCEVGWNNSLQWLLGAIGTSPIVSKFVDANVMNLYGKQFMEHLIKKYKGDLKTVREILFNKWDCNMNGILPIGKDIKLSKDLKAKYIIKLVEFTTCLHNLGVLTKLITKEDLENDDKLFWNTFFCMPTLRYKDTFVGEKFWVNIFMLKYRGLNLFINPITGEVTNLRFLMDRGAETHSKITKGKETGQDDGDTNHGSNLNKIKDALLKDLSIHGYLTQKADGSLCSFTVYTDETLKIMQAYVQTLGTEVAKEIAHKSLEISKGKFLVVLATQGTKSITEDMVPFATTSIFGGIYNNGKPLVSREEFGDKTPLMLWKEHGEKVLERVFAVHAFAYTKYKDPSISLMFEMVCANRRDAFGGKAHEEFACQSTKDQFLFLGLGYSCEETIPHFVVNTHGLFRQPAYWVIKKASQVNDMIRDLQKVMVKDMSQEEFLRLYPPNNPDEFDSLHPEGFCFWAYVDQSTTPLHSAFELPGILTYSKIKTLIYYQGHKVKLHNISSLVEFGRRIKGLIPQADIMFAIYSSGDLQNLLKQLHAEFLAMVDITKPNSQLASIIQEIYGPTQQDSAENVVEGVNEDEGVAEVVAIASKKKSKFVHPFDLFAHLIKGDQKPKKVVAMKNHKKNGRRKKNQRLR